MRSAIVISGIVVAIALAVGVALSRSQNSSPAPEIAAGGQLFSPEELTERGTRTLWLAILGDVFDVSTGSNHYGRGKSYAHFIGRDASRAFATGDSEGDLTDDLSGLSWEDLQGIAQWHGFYVSHETYTQVGRVVGRHYDETGRPLGNFPWEELRRKEEREADVKNRLPQCNSRWTKDSGSTVWCSLKSGGVERSWVGVPRLYREALDPAMASTGGKDYEPSASQSNGRCACAPPAEVARKPPYLREYPGCGADSKECKVT